MRFPQNFVVSRNSDCPYSDKAGPTCNPFWLTPFTVRGLICANITISDLLASTIKLKRQTKGYYKAELSSMVAGTGTEGGLAAQTPGMSMTQRNTSTTAMKDMMQNGNHSINAFSISSKIFIRKAFGPDGVYSETGKTHELRKFSKSNTVFPVFGQAFEWQKTYCGKAIICSFLQL